MKKQNNKHKGRLVFIISTKTIKEFFTMLLSKSRYNVLIKNGDKIIHPLITIDILHNSIVYYDGKRRVIAPIKKIISIDMKPTIPTINVIQQTKQGE